LILQRVRSGRDDGAALEQQHRQQVREGLADARAGLDDGVALGLERLGDELRHLLLRGPVREAGQALRKRAVDAEHIVENQRGTARNRAIPVAPASSGARRTQRTCV
jgi:hypothetical protein